MKYRSRNLWLSMVSVVSASALFGAERQPLRWNVLNDGTGIEWRVKDDARLPHGDHMEMDGLRTALLLSYEVSADRELKLSPTLLWPSLRLPLPGCSNALTFAVSPSSRPRLEINGSPVRELAERISFDGVWKSETRCSESVRLARSIFPSVEGFAAYEAIEVFNGGPDAVRVRLASAFAPLRQKGVKGEYEYGIAVLPTGDVRIGPGKKAKFGVRYGAGVESHGKEAFDAFRELAARRKRIEELVSPVVLESGYPELDVAFRLAKFRAGEGVFKLDCGLVHSPGGGKFYGGFWLNDNIEYIGPWFALTGDKTEQAAFLNSCKMVMEKMKPDYSKIPSAIIAEGTKAWDVKERGDAAMFAVGAARFALMSGRKDWARRLMPGIDWSLEFCRRQLLPEGVVASQYDELEGRYSCGKANLNTSCMYYEALETASMLQRALGNAEKADEYAARAARVPPAIERYFGAELHGFKTYRYHEGCEKLRAWTAAPLCVGIGERAGDTMRAMFSPRIWTGVDMLTEEGDRRKVVWDRSLLHAFRGFFVCALAADAMPNFLAYTRNRLLGEHVPYAIEQWPARKGAHLAAEGALYCRIFTEGLFGLTPVGLGRFEARGRLPKGWKPMALRNVRLGDRVVDVEMDESGARIVERQDMRAIRFKSTKDGTMQDAWFYAPKIDDGRRVPIVVTLHSWSANWKSPHPRDKFLKEAKSRGWALVAPNFRGANDKPAACGSDLAVQDVIDAVDFAKSNAPIDEDRIYLVGSSGGGMMTLLMAGRAPDIWAACYAACPISDLARWHRETSQMNNRWSKYAGMMEKSCGGSPAEKPEEFARRSPLTHLPAARTGRVPVDICEGIHDGHIGSVPVGHAIRAYNALADEKDRISEADIRFIEQNERVPEHLAFTGSDPFFDDSIRIYLRKASANVRLTLFEAGHAGNMNAAADWFTRQRRGRPADWSVPQTGAGSADNSTY